MWFYRNKIYDLSLIFTYRLLISPSIFSIMFEKEYEYYIKNQDQLVKEFDNKFIVIMDRQVVGAYKSYTEAYFGALKFGKFGAFFIQYCSQVKAIYNDAFPSQLIIKPQTE